jgi:hypothetical protein
MGMSHILTLIIAVMVGMVFAGWLRSLPGLSMLPQY